MTVPRGGVSQERAGTGVAQRVTGANGARSKGGGMSGLPTASALSAASSVS
jgi:hypothetical protein